MSVRYTVCDHKTLKELFIVDHTEIVPRVGEEIEVNGRLMTVVLVRHYIEVKVEDHPLARHRRAHPPYVFVKVRR